METAEAFRIIVLTIITSLKWDFVYYMHSSFLPRVVKGDIYKGHHAWDLLKFAVVVGDYLIVYPLNASALAVYLYILNSTLVHA